MKRPRLAGTGYVVRHFARDGGPSLTERKIAMTNHGKDDSYLSAEDVAADEDARRKSFIRGGKPEDAPDKQTEKPTGIVSKDKETGLIDPMTGRPTAEG